MPEPLRLPLTVGLEVEDAKAELRKVVREHRRSRSTTELERLGHELASQALLAIGSARTVALYVSKETEPSTLPLLDALHARQIRVLLPALGPGLERRWALYQGSHDLAQQAPGRPPEPSGERLPPEAIRHADAIITPALAVDGLGNRLGQGGGWYDRMLKLVDSDVPTFSMLFDEELIDTQLLPQDEMDVRVQAVITPTRVFLLEGSRLQRTTLEKVGAQQ